MKQNKSIQFLEGSRAIALAVASACPDVISAFPITPQTHIVENLARLKTEGKFKGIFKQAESETAAASIVLGAAAAGARTYTATSSQGLLHMLEVIYNLPGLHLPAVLTLANRAISAPLNIWNDHSDAMAMRDAGWIMLFAGSIQEAVDMHLIAFKLTEFLKIPVVVNVDGFLLTHASEPSILPPSALVKKFIPKKLTAVLDTKNPKTLGHLYSPEYYQAERLKNNSEFIVALKTIDQFTKQYHQAFDTAGLSDYSNNNNGFFEYYGPAGAKKIIIILGSAAGALKDGLDSYNKKNISKAALIRLKTFRPLPQNQLKKILTGRNKIAVIDRAVAMGANPPLLSDIIPLIPKNCQIKSIVTGLGGQDINSQTVFYAFKNF